MGFQLKRLCDEFLLGALVARFYWETQRRFCWLVCRRRSDQASRFSLSQRFVDRLEGYPTGRIAPGTRSLDTGINWARRADTAGGVTHAHTSVSDHCRRWDRSRGRSRAGADDDIEAKVQLCAEARSAATSSSKCATTGVAVSACRTKWADCVREDLWLIVAPPRSNDASAYRPLKQHNLIQAIARVNRLHEDKQYGLLIDYRGILRELDTAIKELAHRVGGFRLRLPVDAGAVVVRWFSV